MARVTQQPIPTPMLAVFKQTGIKIKNFKTPAAFERELKKFVKRNHVLPLSTSGNNVPRSTPLEYRLYNLTFYVLSEGGGKFINFRDNKKFSFSIAEPYNSDEDYWNYKGLQAWGTAKVYDRNDNPARFKDTLKKMNVAKTLKRLGLKDLPPGINYRVIELTPDRIKYGNPREGVFRVTWNRK